MFVPKYAEKLIRFPRQGRLRFCIGEIMAKRIQRNTGRITAAIGLDAYYIQAIGQALHLDYSVYIFKYNAESKKFCQFVMNTQILKENNFRSSTFPYKHTNVKFAARTPDLKSNAWAFTQCFSLSVWITLAVVIVLLSIMFHWTSTNKKGIPSSFFDVLAAVLAHPSDKKPKTVAQSALLWTWKLALLFLLLCFTSVLLSFLLVPTRERGLETIDDVVKGIVEGNVKAVAQFPVAIAPPILAQGDAKSLVLGRDIQNNGPMPFIYQHDIRRDEAVVEDDEILKMAFSDSRYRISKEAIFEYWLAGRYFDQAFRREVREKVDMVILRMQEAGINIRHEERSKMKVKLFFKKNITNEEENTIKPLSMSDLSGVFYCLLAGHCLSILVLILEICVNRYEKRIETLQD